MKKIRHIIEAIAAYVFFYSFKLAGYNMASAVGGKMGRWIGPLFPVTKTARKNIQNAMPELSEQEVEKIIREMWENLGRVFGEFPHIQSLTGQRFHDKISVEGLENFEQANAAGHGVICINGHFANWEIGARAAYEYGYPPAVVYRPTSNPYVERLVQISRSKSHDGMFGKGPDAARGIIKQLRKKGNVGIMVDQKSNSGLPIDFFGRIAMTDPAVADFGLKFNAPLLPTQVVRYNKNCFKVILHKPILPEGKTREEIMSEINKMLELWIREHPSQWFWVHNRWPKE